MKAPPHILSESLRLEGQFLVVVGRAQNQGIPDFCQDIITILQSNANIFFVTVLPFYPHSHITINIVPQ